MQDSIFTQIIKGEIPCYKVYEDEFSIAFLDIDPLLPGHTLVVPKRQVDKIDELPVIEYQALFNTVKLVSKRLKIVLGADRVVLQVLGFDVPHAHVHVIPTNSGSEFLNSLKNHLNEVPSSKPTQEQFTELVKMLAF